MIAEVPVVSIICPAYNHEKFIAQALDGLVMQKTTFPFEIIVHDDASTDLTVNIIKSYEARFPHLFANIYQTENQFSKAAGNVTIITFAAARGKYIALCEGDDYWTDPSKLQKQVDFLEANPDCTICHHACRTFMDDEEVFDDASFQHIPLSYGIETLSKANIISTLTVMYRNVQIKFPEWFTSLTHADYPMHLMHAAKGEIGFIPEIMAVYRKHHKSTTGSLKSIGQSLFLSKTLEILIHENFSEIVNYNLRLQLLYHYMGMFFYYHDLHQPDSNLYFDKIRELQNVFGVDFSEIITLYRIYILKFEEYLKFGKDDEVQDLLTDFNDPQIRFLLTELSATIKKRINLKNSTSFKFGNKLVSLVLNNPIRKTLLKAKK